jgi:poly(hydroxyalkanoate) depolymerase family esterase
MAEITRLLGTQGAGKATQAIQDALAAAGLTSRPGPTGKRQAEPAQAPVSRPRSATQGFVSNLLAGLGGLGAGSAQPAADAEPETAGVPPPAGSFVSGVYSNGAGSRRYKVYVPSAHVAGRAMPLLVMLHGCTQDPDDFARGTQMNRLAEEQGFLVVYPAQEASANSSRCWNWFKSIDQTRDQGEPSLIAGITHQVIEQYGAHRDEVYVAGLSAGGAMAVIMGTSYPDLYRAVGVHSGLPYAAASDLPSALSAMKGGARRPASGAGKAGAALAAIPVIVFHGDRDATVSPANGERVLNDFMAGYQSGAQQGNSGAPGAISTIMDEGSVEGGHRFSRTSLHTEGRPVLAEHWLIHGAGHAWAGGSAQGTYTDAKGPDASREMLRFFKTQGT